MAPPTTIVARGHVAHGLAQSAAVWALMVVAGLLIVHPAVPWVLIVTGVVAGILLGRWHQRRSRPDTAVGAFTGSVLWPVLLGASLIATLIVAGE